MKKGNGNDNSCNENCKLGFKYKYNTKKNAVFLQKSLPKGFKYVENPDFEFQVKNAAFRRFHDRLFGKYEVCPYKAEEDLIWNRFNNRIERAVYFDYIIISKDGFSCKKGWAVPYSEAVLNQISTNITRNNVKKEISDHPPILARLSFTDTILLDWLNINNLSV